MSGFGAIFPAPGRLAGFPSSPASSRILSHPSTSAYTGGNYMNPLQRQAGVFVSIDMLNLPTLPERMDAYLTEALIFHLKDVAEAVIDHAQQQLVPGHGYDTGLLHNTLVYRLVEHLLGTAVAYDLLSEQAYYWRWVEFGHWTRGGTFWQGYHFLEQAILANESRLRRAVRDAWADAMIKLAGEARVAIAAAHVPGGGLL